MPVTDAAPTAKTEPFPEAIPLQQPQARQATVKAEIIAAPHPRTEAAGKSLLLLEELCISQ